MNINISELLTSLMPDKKKTDFLKLCLTDLSMNEYEKYLHADLLEQIKDNSNGFKRPLALLYFNLKRNEIETDNNYSSYLKTAYVREELRSSTFKNILSNTLRGLLNESCEFILLDGAYLAESIYYNRSLRHCHDIDILGKDNSLEEIASILINNGFTKESNIRKNEIEKIVLHHKSGLILSLHNRLFDHSSYNYNNKCFWERAQIKNIVGLDVLVLSGADLLFHILGKAFINYFSTLQWVADSVFLLRNAGIDWELFCENAEYSGLSISLLPMLKYLINEFEVNIPGSVFINLQKAVENAEPAANEAALFFATNRMRSGFLRLLQHTSDWKQKFSIIRFGLFPSKSSLEWNDNYKSVYKINLNHLKRMLSFYKND
ncbi:MAG: nucleotidyltransferase family protein [Ignavibacteriaceae bacterium]